MFFKKEEKKIDFSFLDQYIKDVENYAYVEGDEKNDLESSDDLKKLNTLLKILILFQFLQPLKGENFWNGIENLKI